MCDHIPGHCGPAKLIYNINHHRELANICNGDFEIPTSGNLLSELFLQQQKSPSSLPHPEVEAVKPKGERGGGPAGHGGREGSPSTLWTFRPAPCAVLCFSSTILYTWLSGVERAGSAAPDPTLLSPAGVRGGRSPRQRSRRSV